MITLYIKTHRKTGLKYFGKTTADDPIAYWGSGLHWRRHLMKHGYDCDTEIYLQSEDQEYIIQEALRFSRVYDIVKSDLWANLQEENGIDGWPKGISNPGLSERRKGIPLSEETRLKIGNAHRGRIKSKEECENLSKGHKGRRNSQETRRKMSIAHLDVPLSKEHIEKVVEDFKIGY